MVKLFNPPDLFRLQPCQIAMDFIDGLPPLLFLRAGRHSPRQPFFKPFPAVETGAPDHLLGVYRAASRAGQIFVVFSHFHEPFKDLVAGGAFKFIYRH